MLLTIESKIQSVVSHVLYYIILCCAILCLLPSVAHAKPTYFCQETGNDTLQTLATAGAMVTFTFPDNLEYTTCKRVFELGDEGVLLSRVSPDASACTELPTISCTNMRNCVLGGLKSDLINNIDGIDNTITITDAQGTQEILKAKGPFCYQVDSSDICQGSEVVIGTGSREHSNQLCIWSQPPS